MKPFTSLFSPLLGKTTLAGLALGALLFTMAPAAKAADWDDACNRRVRYTESRYRDAVEDHGRYSRQARHWAHERDEAYQRCRFEHRRDWR